MNIRHAIVHNFRSILDASFSLENYSLLVGENNSGKTSLITALRAFYEDGGQKYSKSIDFPKLNTTDNESWIEIHYGTDEDEQLLLKKEYRSPDSVLRVRRYFQSDDPERVKPNQSNIYAYENGELSKSLFYGAKNISQAKLGTVIYIPEVSKTDDTLKLSGPSPLREMVHFIMNRAVLNSDSFGELTGAFESFNEKFQEESSKEGFSVQSLTHAINAELEQWRIRFGVTVNQIRPEDIVKTLLSHYIEDLELGGQRVGIAAFGQGLQRHLIYTLIRLSAKFSEPRREGKKDFSPNFTFLLFEEPEAFLHPTQQERMNQGLRDLASSPGQQILVTTHSPTFVSKNISDLPAVIRLVKGNGRTTVHQIEANLLETLLDSGSGLLRYFQQLLENPSTPETLRTCIRRDVLPTAESSEEILLLQESLRFLMWLNAERACLFFAKHVVICEGATEKVLFDYLVDQKWSALRDRHIYFLDAGGKYNIHRYLALLSALAIPHSILIDGDCGRPLLEAITEYVKSNMTSYTIGHHIFELDIENWLGISAPPRNRGDMKPLNALTKVRSGEVLPERIDRLKDLLMSIIPKEDG